MAGGISPDGAGTYVGPGETFELPGWVDPFFGPDPFEIAMRVEAELQQQFQILERLPMARRTDVFNQLVRAAVGRRGLPRDVRDLVIGKLRRRARACGLIPERRAGAGLWFPPPPDPPGWRHIDWVDLAEARRRG